jgi:hypothetical protein
LLNKYFPEEYICNLKGYENYARFLPIVDRKISYQAVPTVNRKGSFKNDRKNKLKLINVSSDRNDKEFQFTIAVDYRPLPFSDNYKTTISNYQLGLGYQIRDIKVVSNKIYEVTDFEPTHVITLYTSSNPYGNLELVFKHNIPKWIDESDIDNENQIDEDHTFGLKYLTSAISEAYEYKSKGKDLAIFKIEISK